LLGCVYATVLPAGTTNDYNNQVPTLSSNVGAYALCVNVKFHIIIWSLWRSYPFKKS